MMLFLRFHAGEDTSATYCSDFAGARAQAAFVGSGTPVQQADRPNIAKPCLSSHPGHRGSSARLQPAAAEAGLLHPGHPPPNCPSGNIQVCHLITHIETEEADTASKAGGMAWLVQGPQSAYQ